MYLQVREVANHWPAAVQVLLQHRIRLYTDVYVFVDQVNKDDRDSDISITGFAKLRVVRFWEGAYNV